MKFQAQFAKAKTVEEAKKIYRALALENHPDRGGSTEAMKQINLAYEATLTRLEQSGEEFDFSDAMGEMKQYEEKVDVLMTLPGLEIELVGKWLWVSGDTFPVKDTLKANGFRWASKKRRWYWRPEEYKSRSRRRMTMDEVKRLHGVKWTKKTEEGKKGIALTG